jgi:hypothetical protein
MFAQRHDKIEKNNQSTVDVFCKPSLLSNIQTIKGNLVIHCNARKATTNMVGEFDRYGTVWYHPDGIANVLLLAKVKNKYKVTYNSSNDNKFVVHKLNGKMLEFHQYPSGLFYFDTKDNGMMLVNTVADNKSIYTNADYFS